MGSPTSLEDPLEQLGAQAIEGFVPRPKDRDKPRQSLGRWAPESILDGMTAKLRVVHVLRIGLRLNLQTFLAAPSTSHTQRRVLDRDG